MELPEVEIWTDGACSPNPGPGGWGAILLCGKTRREICGFGPKDTTNNKMELQAAIEALKAIKRTAYVTLHSDSQYVVKGITEWIDGWIKKRWKGVKNREHWEQLYEVSQKHHIEWVWVRAHVGNELNECADELANHARINQVNEDNRYGR